MKKMVVVDANDKVLGRLSSLVAKKLLDGENVTVINASNAVITGTPAVILEKFAQKRARGSRKNGPFIHRQPESILRRAIRGMLPIRKKRGRVAYTKLIVHNSNPDKVKKIQTIGKGLPEVKTKFIRLKAISEFLGARVR